MHSFAVVALFGLVAAASAGGLLAGHGLGYGGHGLALGHGVAHVAHAVHAAPIVAPVAVHAGYARSHHYSSAINHGAVVGKAVHAVAAPVAVSHAIAAPVAAYGHGIGLAHGYGGFGYGAKLW